MNSPGPEETILDAALAKPRVERAAFVEQACGGDERLLALVQALLRAHEQSAAAFPGGDRDKNSGTIRVSLTGGEGPGDRIGHYKLLQQLGEGGCGVVYMAEQEEPVRRRVALKVIKLGMDTRQVIARFEAERQALAMMDHPNIAKVLDAGTTETGRPYFVMELVRGIKVTDYCDQNNLRTQKRLDLFIQICKAIQHAHQKGIIHRDIKPSNILVTLHDGVPVPKVIDFGIAKAIEHRLTDKTLFTALEQFVGTPAYMSPEQAEMSGLDIDTRSDIYSLGVLLYELLSGKVPFEGKDLAAAGLEAMRRIIRERDPVPPSTRISTLDAAEQTTIARRRQTEAPKLIHLVRGDLDWIVMKCLEKDRTRRYETTNGLARDIERFLASEPVSARPPSNLYRFRKLVRRNKVSFASSTAVLMALLLGLAVSLMLLARERETRKRAVAAESKAVTQMVRSDQVAGLLKQALLSAGPSVAKGRDIALIKEILDQTSGRLENDLKDQPEVESELRETIGKVYDELGLHDRAEEMLRRALSIETRLGATNDNVIRLFTTLSLTLSAESKFEEAESAGRKAHEMALTLFGAGHSNTIATLNNLAMALQDAGKLDAAESLFRQCLDAKRKSAPESIELASALNNLVSILQSKGEEAKTEPLQREALQILIKRLGENDVDVAAATDNLGKVLLGTGRTGEAVELQRKALAIRTKLLARDHPEVIKSMINLAETLARADQLAEAESLWREAADLGRKGGANTGQLTALALDSLGVTMVDQNRLNDAEEFFNEAVTLQRKYEGAMSPNLARTLMRISQMVRKQGRLDEALAAGREAADIRMKLAPNQWSTHATRVLVGNILVAQKRFSDAEVELLASYEGLRACRESIPPSGKGVFERSILSLVKLYEVWQKTNEAALWNAKLPPANSSPNEAGATNSLPGK